MYGKRINLISFLLCMLLVMPAAPSLAAEYKSVELMTNGGFELTDEHDFPLGWSSNGQNLIIGGDFETGTAALSSVGTSPDGSNLKWGAPNTKANSLTVAAASSDDKEKCGNYYAKTIWTTKNWGGMGYANLATGNELFKAAFGSSYIMRADYRVSSTDAFNMADVRAYYLLAAGTPTVKNATQFESTFTNTASVPSTEWQEYSTTMTLPDKPTDPNYTYYDTPHVSRLQLRYMAGPVLGDGETADMDVDNIRLEKIGRASSLSPLSGEKSLKIVGYADGVDEVWTSSGMAVESGEAISVQSNIYAAEIADFTEDGTVYPGKVTVNAVFDSGETVEIGYTDSASADYVNISADINAPENASSFKIEIVVSGQGTVFADDISASVLRETPEAEVPAGFVNVFTNGGFESCDKYGFPDEWDSEGKNLISNSDFESGAVTEGTNWDGSYSNLRWGPVGNLSSAAIDETPGDEKAEHGNYIMKMNWKATGWGGMAITNDDYGAYRAAYDGEYILRSSYKAGANTDFTGKTVQFNVITNGRSTLAAAGNVEKVAAVTGAVPTTSWQEAAVTYKIQPKSETDDREFPLIKRFQFRMNGAASAAAVLYADNISIEKLGRCSDEKFSGSKSLMIQGYADGLDEKWISDSYSVTGGETAYVGAAVKMTDIAAGASIDFIFEKADGTAAGTETIDLGTGSFAWKQYAREVNVPALAESVHAEITVKNGNGKLWVDDLFTSVEDNSDPEHINAEVPADIFNALANPGFENTRKYDFPAGWSSEGENLIANSDFESGSTDVGANWDSSYQSLRWGPVGGAYDVSAVLSSESENEENGSYVAKILWNNAMWGGMAVVNDVLGAYRVAYNSDYILRGSYRADNDTDFANRNMQFNIITNGMTSLDSTGNRENAVTLTGAVPTASWQDAAVTYTIAQRGESDDREYPLLKRIQFRNYGANSAEAVLYADNVRMEKLGRTSADSLSGDKALMIVGYKDGADEVWTSDSTYSVTPGQKVYYGGYAKLSKIKTRAKMGISFYDIDGIYISKSEFSLGQGTKDWAYYSEEATAPEQAAYCTMELTVENGAGTAYFDDMFMGAPASGVIASAISANLSDLASNPGAELTVSAKVYNYEDTPVTAAIAAAIYKDGKLVDMGISHANAERAGTPIAASVTVPTLEYEEYSACEAKAFLFDYNTLAPIGDKEIIPGDSEANAIKVSKLYSDNMVLQQGQSVDICGTAPAGQTVTVSIAGQEESALAAADGSWSVTLNPLTAGGPYDLKIKGEKGQKLIFSNVMAGEVFLISGQSNVEVLLNRYAADGLTDYAENNPNIRMYNIPKDRQTTVQTDLPGSNKWNECTESTAKAFSAVGYLVSKKLSEEMPETPIGIISCAYSGSDIGEWIESETGLSVGVTTSEEKRGTLYNAMLYPIKDYNIKGVIWYQGESSRNFKYQTWLETMIARWRDIFDSSELPFVITQLPGYTTKEFAIVREGQRAAAAADPNVYLSVNIDLGEEDDVHPRDKKELSDRLANVILHELYNKDIPCYGPAAASITAENGSITVGFDYADGLKTTDGEAPRAFIIAGADGVFYNADAVISGNSVILTSSSVAEPVYVRYAFEGFPNPNLVNGDNLPAGPFRNDSGTVIYVSSELD